ncbi:uncharacterized protein LOC133485332 isoform X3 [Phyllopteryx taeniolatus]|uniref:uncharacterized protein LOC133485332 isoform X3 n=1 Tax=Phyllopteryx taeniolatus TaxID=161469 RepID=UPI002AD48501|nr:uncharacterized protein LOC133485332 isoform X3 [Phyllopteryx taeniolatus]
MMLVCVCVYRKKACVCVVWIFVGFCLLMGKRRPQSFRCRMRRELNRTPTRRVTHKRGLSKTTTTTTMLTLQDDDDAKANIAAGVFEKRARAQRWTRRRADDKRSTEAPRSHSLHVRSRPRLRSRWVCLAARVASSGKHTPSGQREAQRTADSRHLPAKTTTTTMTTTRLQGEPVSTRGSALTGRTRRETRRTAGKVTAAPRRA